VDHLLGTYSFFLSDCPVLLPDQFDFSSLTFEYYRRERQENDAVVWCDSNNQTGHFVQFSFRKLTYGKK